MTAKSHQPLVSIIVAVHNETELLRLALTDILNQTYKHFEIIVVDDASDIETSNVVLSFKDSRIHYVRLDQQSGQSAARNRGLLDARGDLIAIADADDRWLPNKLYTQINYLLEHPEVDVVGTWAKVMPHHKEWRTPVMHEAIQGYMFINNPFVHSSVVFKANLLQSNSLYNSKYDTAEDYELFARHVFKWRFANIPDYLTIYRASDKQNTKQQQLAKEIRNNLLLSIIDATEQEKELHYLFSENIAGLKMETIKAWAGKLRFAQHKISIKYLSKAIQRHAWQYFKKNYFTSSSLYVKLSELLQSGMPTAYIAKSLVKIFLNKPL